MYIICFKIWKRLSGRLLFSFQPSFHMMVCTPKGIYHGTTRRYDGKWHIEKLEHNALAKWLIKEL